jgi:hypothetical protein
MSNTLLDFLQNVKISQSDSNTVYVYHDEEGKIHKVSNKKDEKETTLKLLITEKEDVKLIQQGVKRIEDFVVAYDPASKQLRVKELTYDTKIISVQDKLYKVPTDIEDPDLLIQHENNVWRVSYKEEHRKADMKSRDYVLDESSNLLFFFSVTEKNDPNVLYDLFSVPYHELLSNPSVEVESQLKQDKDPSDVSIYVARYFDTYKFEVIE